MDHEEVFSITDFAKFTRTTRDTLLYYDSIGLLSPMSRGKNNYRYYSSGQLAIVNLIRTFQSLGMTLTEIDQLGKNRAPGLVDDLLDRQILRIDEKINEWVRSRKLLLALKNIIHTALDADEGAISLQFMPAEAIVLGELNDYGRNRSDYDALLSFYHSCSVKYPDMDLNYPAWGMFSEERIRQQDYTWPDRYYFMNPEGFDRKPAALYAIGYARGGYGQNKELYQQMTTYIDAHGLEICGPAFEEYPLNEICVLDEKDYLMRVQITVRKKNQRHSDESIQA